MSMQDISHANKTVWHTILLWKRERIKSCGYFLVSAVLLLECSFPAVVTEAAVGVVPLGAAVIAGVAGVGSS